MQIPDSLWQLLQQLVAAIAGAQQGPSVIGPATVKIATASPFAGARWAVMLTPLDGSPAKTLNMAAIPKALGTPEAPIPLPVTVSYTPGIGGQDDVIINVTVDGSELQSVRVLAITPSADSKATEIDFYDPASKITTSLHVASVPSGMAAFDGKSYTFYYVAATGGGLDNIIGSTITVA